MKRAWLLAAALACGCAAQEHLPAYPWTTPGAALHDLAVRAHAMHSLSAAADITLARADGQSIQFDGAIVMEPPAKLRLRAWKFGRAIFDLTLNDDGLFLVTPDDPSLKDKIKSGGLSAAELGRAWATFTSTYFDDPAPAIVRDSPNLVFRRRQANGHVTCEVDRRTLTPRRYTLTDDIGRTRFTLLLDHYAEQDGVEYARRLVAKSDSGTVTIELRDVEINSPPADSAFKPPRRAEKLP